ncbi:MAG TPA: glycine oxidase ThiO [Ktedonobacteraceae bacterium]
MKTSTDVLIAGGGVIGCASAYYLRKAGVEVVVIDAGEIGAEASSAAAGLLAPLGPLSGPGPFADLLLAAFAHYPMLVPELEEASGIHLEYEQTGALRVVCDAKHIPNLRKRMKAWQPLGLQMHWLTGEEARQREPSLSLDVSAAIYVPEESQIRAPLVVQAFAQAAANKGATFYSSRHVTGISECNSRVTGIQTSQGESITCNHLVIATGAWATRCGEWLNIPLPVHPQRGQLLALQQSSPPLQHIIFGEAAYLAPKQDGTIVVGATKDDVGFDKHLTAGGVAWLLKRAIRLAPSLENSAIDRLWTGLRPKTPDLHPILGPAPGWENVSLAVGHGSVGILLSAITGQTIAEVVTTGKVAEIARPFPVERFL